MNTGLYTANEKFEADELIATGHYHREKRGQFFWHTVMLDTQTLIEKGKNYCVVFKTKNNGLLHSLNVKPLEDILPKSFGFRFLK